MRNITPEKGSQFRHKCGTSCGTHVYNFTRQRKSWIFKWIDTKFGDRYHLPYLQIIFFLFFKILNF